MSASRLETWMAAGMVTASAARGETLYQQDGIALEGTVRMVTRGAGACQVLEDRHPADLYEQMKANHGQPLHVWRIDFAARNGSGRKLEHLTAQFKIASEWPPCTNWTGPEGRYPRTPQWAGSFEVLQGPCGMEPGEEVSDTVFMLAFHAREPKFENWQVDYRFGEGRAASPPVTASPERENLFWQSVMNSTNPADFEACLRQFPHGVFRALAQNRLAALGAPGSDFPAASRFPAEAGSQADHVETPQPIVQSVPAPQPICEDERKWDDPPCRVELTSHPRCYAWVRHESVAVSSMEGTGSCANRRAEGSGTLESIMASEFTCPQRATGLLRGGKRTGSWTYRSAANWASEVPYVDGKKHGTEIDRGSRYGTVITTPWVNGKIEGVQIEQSRDGRRTETPCVNGVVHGSKIGRRSDGTISCRTEYVHGEARQ